MPDEQNDMMMEDDIISLDEILEDPYYQAQFDKKVAKANETAIRNAQKNWEMRIAEDQKLASMDEIQKRDYELEKANKRIEEYETKERANGLMREALKQSAEKGIPMEVMTALDYTREDADSIKSKIDIYSKAFQNVKSSAIESYSRESAPQVGEKFNSSSKPMNQMSYEELDEYYKTHGE